MFKDVCALARDAAQAVADIERNRRPSEPSWTLLGREESDSDHADEDQFHPDRLSQDDRVLICKHLKDSITHHVGLPAALGLGHTNVTAKMSALQYAISFECQSLLHLRDLNQAYCAMCTDMGPEMGLTEFEGDLQELLPSWHDWSAQNPQFLRDDLDTADPVAFPHADEERAGPANACIMPNALPIPGICHIIDNLLQDVDQKLAQWAEFHRHLINTAGLLTRDQGLRRVYAMCVQGSNLISQDQFCKQVPSLYEKRWSMVVKYLQAALPLLQVLRSTWNTQLYVADTSGKAQDASSGVVFDIALFTETLSSGWFFCYSEMVLRIHLFAEELRGFVEGCPCHDHMFHGQSQSQRAKSLARDYGDEADLRSCLLAGCRAPELAANLLVSRLQELRVSKLNFIASSARLLAVPVADWATIAHDFQLGCDYLQSGLIIKLAFWQKLPYRLAALAHHSRLLSAP